MKTCPIRHLSMPEHAPQEVIAIWRKMNQAVERRNGQPAIEIVEIHERSPAPAAR